MDIHRVHRVKNVDGNFCTVFASPPCICKLISKIQLVRKINYLGAGFIHIKEIEIFMLLFVSIASYKLRNVTTKKNIGWVLNFSLLLSNTSKVK